MKKIMLTFIGMIALIASHAQYIAKNNTARPEFVNAPGYKQKKIGTVLTVSGGLLFTTGIIFVLFADSFYKSSTTLSGDSNSGVGVAMMAIGLGRAVPGIILWTRGSENTIPINNSKIFLWD